MDETAFLAATATSATQYVTGIAICIAEAFGVAMGGGRLVRLVPLKDIGVLADASTSVLVDRSSADVAGSARRRVLDGFNLHQSAMRLETVYREPAAGAAREAGC